MSQTNGKGRALRARQINFKGEVDARYDAAPLLAEPGDVVLVKRGVPRSLVLACPDGCGSILTINLDRRTGKAWRMYDDRRGLTLHPSVWRDDGCQAHFVVWHNQVRWCDWDTGNGKTPAIDADLLSRILRVLDDQPRSADAIADSLNAIPWDVAAACESLANRGQAQVVGVKPRKFVRAASKTQDEKVEKPIRDEGVEKPLIDSEGWLARAFRALKRMVDK